MNILALDLYIKSTFAIPFAVGKVEQNIHPEFSLYLAPPDRPPLAELLFGTTFIKGGINIFL
jgi:hypothetical protein